MNEKNTPDFKLLINMDDRPSEEKSMKYVSKTVRNSFVNDVKKGQMESLKGTIIKSIPKLKPLSR